MAIIESKTKTDRHKKKQNKRALTIRQERFCKYYVQTGNGSKAYGLAGYTSKAPDQDSFSLRQKSHIIDRIAEIQEEVSASITEAKIVAEISKLAFNDDEGVRNSDQLKALELLGRHKAMFTDKTISKQERQIDME